MPIILISTILSLSLFFINNSLNAANLSVELGKNSTGVAVGRDFGFGYGLVGLSARFIADGPWSYIPTEETLDNKCTEFQDAPSYQNDKKEDRDMDCEEKGLFNDGDEWEIFGKMGFRLPVISKVYLNTGLGVSKKRTTELYIFCSDIIAVDDEKSCSKAGKFVTWGHIEEDYYMTFLGGMSFEMTRKLLLNIDYHNRHGILGGLMWRF